MDSRLKNHDGPLLANLERRLFLRRSLSLGALSLLAGCDLTDQLTYDDNVQKMLMAMSRWNDGVQDWLFDHGAEFWAGMLALGVYHGARMSEVIRSGIGAIPRTQFEASLAMGLTTFQAYRLVILPVALRLIVPPGTSESVNLLKNSSIALTISVAELTFQTRQIETYTARAIEALTAGTLIYLALCLSIAAIMTHVERRLAIPGLIARTSG